MELRIEKLNNVIQLKEFHCGISQLDDFIQNVFQLSIENHYCRAYSVIDKDSPDNRVIALFALSFDSLDLDTDDKDEMMMGTSLASIPHISDEYEDVFKIMENHMKSRDRSNPYPATFLMSGAMVNAMKLIFEEKRFFYRLVNHVAFTPVDDKEIIEHVVKGFLNGMGKSFDRNLAMGACSLFKSNLWYINHLAAICDALSKGFVTEAMMTDALNSMISVHEPRFVSIVNDLTDHQLSLMRAVMDGVVKFSASDVIEKYHLNSSANVRRVKDALKKKEVITFNEKDEPVVLDPLFEYWISRYYFEIAE